MIRRSILSLGKKWHIAQGAGGGGVGGGGGCGGKGVLFQLDVKQSHFHTQHRRLVCGKMYSHQSVTVNMGCLQEGAVR